MDQPNNNDLRMVRRDGLQARSRNTTTQFLPDPEQAKTIGSIINRWRLASGWQLLSKDDQNLTIAAWFQVLKLQGVTMEFYDVCYRAAIATRAAKRSAGADVPFTLAAEAVAAEWPGIKAKLEEGEPGKPLQLVARNATGCERCWGSGHEQMIDGTVRDGCLHEPLLMAERDVFRARRLEYQKVMSEALLKIGTPTPVVQPFVKKKQKPTMLRMQCSHCGRRVNSLEGWQMHERCSIPLKGGDALCVGLMRVSDEAIYARF